MISSLVHTLFYCIFSRITKNVLTHTKYGDNISTTVTENVFREKMERNIMIKSSITHRATREYCYPICEGTFRIRIATAKNDVKRIILHTTDKYIELEKMDTREAFEMEKIATDNFHDYYEAEVKLDLLCLRYFFEIEDESGEIVYLGDDHFFTYEPTDVEDMYDCPQALREEGHPEVPAWAEGKVVYQIFPTRFAASTEVPDELWYKTPLEYNDKLGGTLKGITGKLDYLKELGVDVIYMTPIFKADTQHKYDTIDYYEVDPELGTADDLKELVKETHERGMYIMLDGVFNHTSAKFFAFSDVLEKGENSQYKDWFYIREFPIFRGTRQSLPNYKTFGYFGGMPKLNLSNPETVEYVKNVVCHYLREFDIDGWRMDVADEIGHSFWKKIRLAAKKVKADAFIVGEDWHLCGDFLEGDEWDSCMNYAWYKALGRLYGGNGALSDFVSSAGQVRGRYHSNVFPVLWNLMDSHDTPRMFSDMCGGNEGKFISAAALTLLFPGMPFIYYGDEAGMQGGNDPDNRRGMLWKKELRNAETEDYYRKLIAFRHEHPQLYRNLPEVETLDEEKRIMVLRQEGLRMLFSLNPEQVDISGFTGGLNEGDGGVLIERGMLREESRVVLDGYGFIIEKAV